MRAYLEKSRTAPRGSVSQASRRVVGPVLAMMALTWAGLLGAACGDDDGAGNNNANQNQNQNQSGICGDGRLDQGEECDDGARNSDVAADACRTNCRQAHCGDEVTDSDEECDDGDDGSNRSDACPGTCLGPVCGDGHLLAGVEACDDGNTSDGDDCRGDCMQDMTDCGNGDPDPGEACDQGAQNSDTVPNACRTSCQLPSCGDGVRDEAGPYNEECDNGALNSDTVPNACRTSCEPAGCGDGVVDAGETCDNGSANSDTVPNACRTSCEPASCGDGVIDTDEICDNGSANSDTAPDACRTSCEVASCGDGVIDTDETCDNGSANSDTVPNACRTSCEPASCGDGVIDPGEECEGTNLGGATCDSAGHPGGGTLSCTTGCSFDTSACCQDPDGDGYGVSCDLGPDCDDQAPGIVGACQANGCPQGWAYIPAGDFEMGCNSGELDGTCQTNEQPRHTVTMTAYCMELTEVSVAAYRACKVAGVCTGTPDASGGAYNWTSTPSDRETHPINGINWAESSEYCQAWMGGDLPSEAQWEKAARGGPGDTRKYPWGASPEPDCTRANGYFGGYCNATYPPYTWPVGYLTTTAGDSPYGLKDMAGNVWEWVQDYYSSTFYNNCTTGCTDPLNTSTASSRAFRGGSYLYGASLLRVVGRLIYDPSFRYFSLGFRCRRTP